MKSCFRSICVVAIVVSVGAAGAEDAARPSAPALTPAAAGVTYGAAPTADGALTVDAVLADTALAGTRVKLSGQAAAVCQKKGCWLTLAASDGRDLRVTFKDYAYFVPADLVGCEVVVEGQLEVTEQSVDELRHLAEDGGQSAEEVAAITAPKQVRQLVADGVLVVKRPS